MTWWEKDKHIFMLLKLIYNVSSKYKTRGWTDACPLWTGVCPSWLDACLLWTYVSPTWLDRRPSTLDTWLSKLIPFFNLIPEGVNISKRYFTAWLIYKFFNFWRFYFFKILKYFPWAWTDACPRWTYACPLDNGVSMPGLPVLLIPVLTNIHFQRKVQPLRKSDRKESLKQIKQGLKVGWRPYNYWEKITHNYRKVSKK